MQTRHEEPLLRCTPTDRPHDPGDAADLSIMGYQEPPEEVLFSEVKVSQVEKKINNLLTQARCMLLIWLNSAQEDFNPRD
jgi:hypothetical protein